jgi:hypothetical protein
MKLLLAAIAASTFACAGSAVAGTTSVTVSTSKGNAAHWTVYEVSQGNIVHAAPTYIGTSGSISKVAIPFTDNDGYYYAQTKFNIPKGAVKITLAIAGLYADDRTVVELNGKVIGATGINAPGTGAMTFSDGGANNAYNFTTANGAKINHVTSGFVTGDNYLKVIVNNTGLGISGAPVPPLILLNQTSFGMSARVLYTIPSKVEQNKALTASLR